MDTILGVTIYNALRKTCLQTTFKAEGDDSHFREWGNKTLTFKLKKETVSFANSELMCTKLKLTMASFDSFDIVLEYYIGCLFSRFSSAPQARALLLTTTHLVLSMAQVYLANLHLRFSEGLFLSSN